MRNPVLERIGAASGAAYVVGVIVAGEALMQMSNWPSSNDSAHEIGSYLRTHAIGARIWAGVYLEILALVAFIAFVAYLKNVLRRADSEGWLPTAVLTCGLAGGIIKLSSVSLGAAALWRADDGISDGVAAGLIDANAAAFVLTWAVDAVMIAAAAGVILQTRCLPRWLGWARLASAPLVLASIPLAAADPPTFLLALLWFVAVSVVLVLRAGEARAIETEALATA
jgi:energy-converting hydrogenase Eha subunit E